MTTEEKLQAVYEAGFSFVVERYPLCNINPGYWNSEDGRWVWSNTDYTSIKSAVDWLYENTVGKKNV